MRQDAAIQNLKKITNSSSMHIFTNTKIHSYINVVNATFSY